MDKRYNYKRDIKFFPSLASNLEIEYIASMEENGWRLLSVIIVDKNHIYYWKIKI